MARIFRALLVAAVNAIKEFFAFATDNGESQVGDSVKLNDGMATSNYDWSAYPSDTEITGDYTQTGTIEKVKQIGNDFVYGMQEPEQDNKDVKIQAGEMYYAYTNANDESVYTADNPISKETFILENATVVGELNNNNGVYSGFLQNNYIKLNTSSPANSLEFIIAFIPNSTSPGDILRSQPDGAGILLRNSACYLSSTGSGWNILSDFSTGLTYTAGVLNYIKITWDSTNGIYTFWQSLDGETWTEKNSSDSGKAAVYWNNTQTLGACSSYSEYFNGSIDLTKTKAVIDGVTTNFGYFSNPSVLYENTGTTEFTPEPLEPQPEFELGTGVIATDLQNGALVIPVHEIHNSMEMVIHFKTGSSWPNLCLCDSSKDGTQSDHSIYFQNYNVVLKAWLYSSSYTSGDADIANDYSVGFTLDLNTEYWFKTTWDGTTYKFYKSTNGNDYTIGNTLNSTVPINWNNNNLYLGNIYNTSVSDVYKNIYLNGTYIKVDGETIFNGSTAVEDIDFTNTGCTLTGFASNTIKIGNNLYKRNSNADETKSISGVSVAIDTVDNTTIQSVTIISDQTATIETSTNITTSNNDNVITDGSYHFFNLTVPTGMTSIIENSGASYQVNEMPLLLKNNSSVGLLLKDNNNSYYRNYWVVNRDYDLHYQQINFSYPSGATVTCKVNNAEQSNLAPYVYCGDIVSWTCDNSGTITTGTYTVKYSNLDGNIQTIIIS